MYHFSDDSCNSLHIQSSWRGKIKLVDSSSQTSAENAYETTDSNCQTGTNTVSIEKVVKTKDDTASLMAFCKGRLKKYDESTWRNLLDQGTVTIDAEIVTNPAIRIRAGTTISYVDCKREVSCQTIAPEHLLSDSDRSASASSDVVNDESYEESKDGGNNSNSSSGNSSATAVDTALLAKFLSKVTPTVFKQLENNLQTKALFEEFHHHSQTTVGAGIGSGHDDTDVSGGVGGGNTYWKTLSVDLEKLKIVYPDWSAASVDYTRARIVRLHRTRVGDRVYDLELQENSAGSGRNRDDDKGVSSSSSSMIHNVREEYLRVHVRCAGAGSGGGGSSSSGYGNGTNKNQQQLPQQQQTATTGPLTAGIRVFAISSDSREEGKDSRGDRSKRSSSRTSGGSDPDSYFLPGTIEKCYKGTYDVRLNNGRLLEGCAAGDIISAGLALEQMVETRKPVMPRLQCTGCVWNNTGSSLAVSYGVVNIRGWCTAPGCVAIWNLFSRRFDPSQPTYILDHSSALTVVRFHPEMPSLLVAGSVTGEILVWDLNSAGTSGSGSSSSVGVGSSSINNSNSNNAAPISLDPIHVTAISEFSHKEPVMDIQWVSTGSGGGNSIDDSSNKFLISSVSADGKLLFWSLKNKLKHPIKGYLLTPQGGARNKGPYPAAHGGVCLSTMEQGSGSSAKTKWLLIGQEGGHVMRSQVAKLIPSGSSIASLTAESFKNATYAEDVYSSIHKSGSNSGGVFYYESHVGNVNAIDASPYHRSLFVSVGNDGDIHLCNLLEKKPLRCFENLNARLQASAGIHVGSQHDSLLYGNNNNHLNASFANVTCVKFSPLKPTIFATASMNGFVSIYDLSSPTASPLYQLDVQADFSRYRKSEEGNNGVSITTGIDSGDGGMIVGITNLAFNAVRKNLFAACDSSGNIHIYKLNSFMSNANINLSGSTSSTSSNNNNQLQADIDYLNQIVQQK